jgi:hypothetical protein
MKKEKWEFYNEYNYDGYKGCVIVATCFLAGILLVLIFTLILTK